MPSKPSGTTTMTLLSTPSMYSDTTAALVCIQCARMHEMWEASLEPEPALAERNPNAAHVSSGKVAQDTSGAAGGHRHNRYRRGRGSVRSIAPRFAPRHADRRGGLERARP